MALVPDETNQTVGKIRLLPQPLKPAILLHQGFDIRDHDAVFSILNVLNWEKTRQSRK
jgi:hypothetical protein